MIDRPETFIHKTAKSLLRPLALEQEELALFLGAQVVRRIASVNRIQTAEFRAASQWGGDPIIQCRRLC